MQGEESTVGDQRLAVAESHAGHHLGDMPRREELTGAGVQRIQLLGAGAKQVVASVADLERQDAEKLRHLGAVLVAAAAGDRLFPAALELVGAVLLAGRGLGDGAVGHLDEIAEDLVM